MSWWSDLDNEIYVDVNEVKRRFDVLPQLSESWWPQALEQNSSRPTAVLARQVASPSYEMMRFVRLTRRLGFHALVIEHRSDRFTVHNPYKRSLATLPIVVGRSRNGNAIIRRQKVADLAAAEGCRLEQVVTYTGESLVDYHHRKLAQVLGFEAPRMIDLRDIMPGGIAGPSDYYLEFFKMLSGRLILFEDFVSDDQTAAFFQRTVLPAYQQAASATGRAPQIVRLVPGRRTSLPIWNSYVAAVADDPSWIRQKRLPELITS